MNKLVAGDIIYFPRGDNTLPRLVLEASKEYVSLLSYNKTTCRLDHHATQVFGRYIGHTYSLDYEEIKHQYPEHFL